MIKFDLIDGYYIEKIDDRNIAICKDEVSEKGNTYKTYEGYYSTYENAWRSACKKLPLKAGNFSMLISVIDRLEKLSKTNPFIQK